MRGSAEHELGIGISFGAAPLGACETAARDARFDFAEVAPQPHLRAFRDCRDSPSIVVNSEWVPVGGSCEPDPALISLLEENVKLRRPIFVCEQLSFNRFPTGAGSRATGYPLPPPHTPSGVAVAAARIEQLRRRLGVPVAFEIGRHYFAKRAEELADGDFYAATAQRADCGIVLDLASLLANERDGRDTVEAVVARLPLERIWEVQVPATGALEGRRLAERIVPTLPRLRAIVSVVVPQSPGGTRSRTLADQHAWLSAIWDTRGTLVKHASMVDAPHLELPGSDDARAQVEAWERSIISGIAGVMSPDRRDAEAFAALETLVADARKAAIARAGEYGLRLLEATLGKHRLADLFGRYCSETHAELLPEDEARQFLHFVERERLDVPFLQEVVAFERAAADAHRRASETTVYFSCEPTEIFRALLRHDRPYARDPRPHAVHVGPLGIRIEGPLRQAG